MKIQDCVAVEVDDTGACAGHLDYSLVVDYHQDCLHLLASGRLAIRERLDGRRFHSDRNQQKIKSSDHEGRCFFYEVEIFGQI